MKDKWCESWEKNFDSTLKALNKFKDDLKEKPELPQITEKRFSIYLDLLQAEIEELKTRFQTKQVSIKREVKVGE
jgi:hypothetical protein